MTSPNSIPGLFESLKSTIREWIQDKIDIATTARDEALGYRNNANTYRAGAQTARDQAEVHANNAASAATAAVTTAVNELKGNAPAAFDTLGEIADWINDSEDATAALLDTVAGKAPLEHDHVSADITDAVSYFGSSMYGDRLVKTNADSGHLHDAINPSDDNHLARKGYVDSEVATRAPATHTHDQSQVTGAATSSTGTPEAGKLVRLNSSGSFNIARTPSSDTELVNKGYVDGQVATRASNISMTVGEYQAGTSTSNRVIQPDRLKAAIQYHGVAQATSGSGLTLWAGNQSAYDALPSGTKNAAGFVAIISG